MSSQLSASPYFSNSSALLAEILVARHIFGLSRGYDQYLVVYAVASMVVFNTASVFDTVAVFRLVRIREDAGADAFWRSSNRLLLQAMFGGLLFATGLAAVHLPHADYCRRLFCGRKGVGGGTDDLFAPWVLVVIPYYAVRPILNRCGISIGYLALKPSQWWCRFWFSGAGTNPLACLPVAFGSGYIVAATMLFFRRGLSRPKSGTPQGLLRGMANQHLANQLGTAAGFVDRYFQSFLASGGI